jgi:hypothetical protein
VIRSVAGKSVVRHPVLHLGISKHSAKYNVFK